MELGSKLFVFEKSGKAFQAADVDYVHGTCNGNAAEKEELMTNIVLEAANFRSKRRWFGSDRAQNAAARKTEFEFWVLAGESEDGKLVAPIALKLLSCCSAMGDVERCHKVTVRMRTKVSNRKLDSTTEAYCKIAVSESNKRYKELATPNVLQAFRSRLSKLRKIREERLSAAQAISEARRIGEAAEEDEYGEHNELNLLLDEACDEMGCEFESSDEEL